MTMPLLRRAICRIHWLALAAVLGFSGQSAANDTDGTHDALEKVKSVYAKSQEQAKTDLLAAFDRQIQEMAKKGNLESVKSLRAEEKAFAADGKLPASTAMKTAVADYEATNDKARNAMTAGFEAAIGDYTKSQQIDKANEVQNELLAFKKDAGYPASSASWHDRILTEIPSLFPITSLITLLVLLATPIIIFCSRGWKHRKDNVLSAFTDVAATRYFEAFHPAELAWNPKKLAAANLLARHYNFQFGRLRFVVPTLLILAVAFILLAPSAVSLGEWVERKRDAESSLFPLVLVLAILGGYIWVLYDLILKSLNELLSPRDVYWGIFRLVIGAPVGFVLAKASPVADLNYAVAFCIGAFPTRQIFTLMRRIYQKATSSAGAQDGHEGSELQSLPSIDLRMSEILQDEGITSIHHLANCDPVRLTIQTGLPFSYIVGIMGDAILWTYLGNKENMEAFRLCGINGAYDCALLQNDLTGADLANKADALAIIKHLADGIKVPEAGLYVLLWNVAHDPNTMFIVAVW